MSNLTDLFRTLSEKSVRLALGEQGELVVRSNKQTLTPELVAQIKQFKPDILAKLSEESQRVNSIPQQPRNQFNYPLSATQRRLWFIEKYQSFAANYATTAALKLTGPFDVSVANQAFNYLVNRHEPLRTRFIEEAGEPRQVIDTEVSFAIAEHDLRHFSGAEQDVVVQEHLNEAAKTRFDLENELMLKVVFLRLSENQGVLISIIHHITMDAWSMNLFNQEFVQAYEAYANQVEPRMPELPIQYLDYTLFHQSLLERAAPKQLTYWLNKLKSAPAFHSLPVVNFVGNETDNECAYEYRWYSKETAAGLKALAGRSGVSMFVMMHAIMSLMVARYSNQDKVLVGTTFTNRQQDELMSLIGFFANTVALYSDISDNPEFQVYLERMRKTYIEANANQDVPFDAVVDELNPPRRAGRSPLFQIIFEYEQAEQLEAQMNELHLEPMYGDKQHVHANFDLTMRAETSERGLYVGFEYNAKVIETATINAMLATLEPLIAAILNDPKCAVKSLDMGGVNVISSERQIALPQQCLHQRFEQQVLNTPQSTAVVCDQGSFSYAELNERANQLAHCLRALGVGPGSALGVCMLPDIDLPLAILSILKAGGRYIPFDAKLPQARILAMAEDAQLTIMLTQQSLAELFEGQLNVVLSLDESGLQSALQGYSTQNPAVSCSTTDLAYQIYTSGSSGQPKGVLVEHGSVVHYLDQVALHYQPPLNSIVTTSIGFDATVTSFWYPLLNGGSCEFPTEDSVTEQIRHHLAGAPKLFKLTPAHLEIFSKATKKAQFDAAHCIVIGGESLTNQVLAPWQAMLPNAVFVNEYGPTEATVGCISHCITPAEKTGHTIDIGLPLANVEAVLVNDCGAYVPNGGIGELYIGGPGLAKGYLHGSPEQNERFTKLPGLSGRFYKTGDMVCQKLNLDGNTRTLEFIGRVDEQVKLRGFRIEVAEINALICTHEAVELSYTCVLNSENNEARLTSYLVTEALPEAELREVLFSLKASLRQQLPDYMQPVDYIFVTELPLTVNGKVDVAALPGAEKALADSHFRAPKTEVEKTVIEIWSEVLGIPADRIGLDDNFFSLGGHSLLVVKVLATIREKIYADFNPTQLFDRLTVADLATALNAAMAQNSVAQALSTVKEAEELEW